jgi:lysophospholipase L1-like esterase
MGPNKMTMRKAIFGNLLVIAISLVVSVAVAEFVCRFLPFTNDTDPAYKLAHPVLPFVMRPNSESVSLQGHVIKTNSQGLRDFEYSVQKPSGTFRILVLGDSVSYAYGQDMENGFAKVLERQLNAAQDKRYKSVEVINAAHNGFHILDQYNYLRLYGLAYSPDALIIGINSSHFAAESQSVIIKDGVDFAPGSAWLRWGIPPWVKRVLRRSYLYMTIGTAYRNRVYEGSNAGGQAAVVDEESRKIAETTAAHLDEMLSLAAKNALPIYFVYQPNRRETTSGSYEAPMLVQLIRDRESQGGLIYVDTLRDFQKFAQNTNEVFPVTDGAHPNAKGHRILADGLFNQLAAKIR